MSPTAAPPLAADPRRKAFATPAGPEVFSGVVHGNQIWTPDPFDVESIHTEARDEFARLLNRASSKELPPTGKTLLLLGEAGSGKSHLMRAFRTAAHATGDGYCGYLQMTSRSDNYARYLLSNLIDSLEQPYKPGSPETGLRRLARGVVDLLDDIPTDERNRLADDPTLDPTDAAKLVHRLAYAAVQYPQFQRIDIDVIRGVLFVLANDTRLHALTLKWLRCEDLGRYDRDLLGDLVPRPQAEMPIRTVVDLGRLMHAVHDAALVLLVDQIEQVIDMDRMSENFGDEFRSAINTLIDVADGVPNAVVVVGCLEDLFTKGRALLPRPKLDRLEHDPEPVRLSSRRTEAEIAAMIAPRVEAIFDTVDVVVDPTDPIAPYTATDVKGLIPFRPRDILDNLRRHREECFRAGEWVAPKWAGTIEKLGTGNWEQKWNDFHKLYKTPVLSDEPRLAELLAFTVRTVSSEMPNGTHFGADPDGRFVPVEIHGAGNTVDQLLVAVCDKSTRGGGLGKQVEEVVKRAGELAAVIVRSTEFPKDPKAVVSQEIAKLIAPRGKGRRVVVADSDWRAMAAFRDFHAKHHAEHGFAGWQRSDRPLAELPAVNAILALDKLLTAPPVAVATPAVPPPPAGVPKPAPLPPVVPTPAAPADFAVRLGVTRGAVCSPVELRPKELCRHAAFLGGSGSGKTTAALTVIEQLLVAGIPAVLLDRKGDLAQYANPAVWTAPESDAGRAAKRDKLRAAIDVRLYTPGKDSGRPLAIPVVPAGLGSLSTADREQMAQFAAASLGTMMGYKGKNPDPKLVVLQKAIEVLGAAGGPTVTVKAVQRLVAERDDALTAAVDGFEDKHYKKLADDLLTLGHQHRRLLDGGDALDIDALLGRGPHAIPGKTRLTVINTQFLGDAVTTDFWVSQFLLAVDRWRAKSPAPEGTLQAVFLFDEADQYLPATGRVPASKGPMESLLKRGRSAGIGIFLATQSPGDFDYKCRDNVLTWFVGRVKEPVAIGKLKPMLAAGRVDAASKLPGQEAGQFFLVREASVTPIQAERNLIPTTQLSEESVLAAARA